MIIEELISCCRDSSSPETPNKDRNRGNNKEDNKHHGVTRVNKDNHYKRVPTTSSKDSMLKFLLRRLTLTERPPRCSDVKMTRGVTLLGLKEAFRLSALGWAVKSKGKVNKVNKAAVNVVKVKTTVSRKPFAQ